MAEPLIVFFDGYCNLCNGVVRFLLDRDVKGALRFASLQSDFAEKFFREHDWDPGEIDSIVVYADGQFSAHSDAVIEISARLSGLWRGGRLLRFLPVAWRDWLYRLVARHRYRIFGRRDSCRVATEAEAARFLG